MKVSLPQPFFFEAGKRAVLLLHGFTGNSADVRILGRFLEKNGYTTKAPHFKGHGVSPLELIKTGPVDWWQDVEKAYDELVAAGYNEIAVVGLSLGGVFSLRLGYLKPLKGIVTMCAPMTMRTTDTMFSGILKYAKDFSRAFGYSETETSALLESIKQEGMPSLPKLPELIQDVRRHVDEVYAPIFVVQARHDEVINPKSAQIIYDTVESIDKHIKWYEESGHVITLGKEKKQLHEDILAFLNSLDWQE
ncbi:alpha/beta hydrolase [Kurthia massiliensis]|uniref:alpha/beta hydrolase n=1 Tax=Kurthia massiliensis TaxID=1033739 RepID=UPI000288830D|nr:carboxylesterase [Kurthia massiliensis]